MKAHFKEHQRLKWRQVFYAAINMEEVLEKLWILVLPLNKDPNMIFKDILFGFSRLVSIFLMCVKSYLCDLLGGAIEMVFLLLLPLVQKLCIKHVRICHPKWGNFLFFDQEIVTGCNRWRNDFFPAYKIMLQKTFTYFVRIQVK